MLFFWPISATLLPSVAKVYVTGIPFIVSVTVVVLLFFIANTWAYPVESDNAILPIGNIFDSASFWFPASFNKPNVDKLLYAVS